MYTDGSYLKGCPSWHSEDSLWKAQQIKKILKKNEITPKTICEVGCGAGNILNHLYQTYSSEISYSGFEISPQAFELCKKIENKNIHYYLNDFCKVGITDLDVILLIDVIEHVENMCEFLRIIKEKGKFKIFHIPLDLFVLNILRDSNLCRGLLHPGHIHFFTKEIALEILRINGYEILDYFYTPGFEISGSNWSGKLLRFPRKIVYELDNELGIRIFGGVSLLVLAK